MDSAHGVFRREGEIWTIAFEEHLIRLRDAKGLRYIAALLMHPGAPLHATELRRIVASGDGGAATAERERLKVTQRIKATLRKIADCDPAIAEHFGGAIHTGLYCRYEPRTPVDWDVAG